MLSKKRLNYFLDDRLYPNLYILRKHWYSMSKREVFVTKSALPWQSKEPAMATYYAEIGDTSYGKAGLYREKVELGAFPVGMHERLRLELLNSNTVFESPFWGGEDLKLRQIISA